ncbi:MAG: peptidyl-dipeptidase A [Myxococcota bacterium]|jgi:peptidyl-dipeptidase A
MRSALILLVLAGCAKPIAPTPDVTPPAAPTPADADAFIVRADAALRTAWVDGSMADWAYETDITDAHEAAASAQSEVVMTTLTALIDESRQYSAVEGLSDATARKLHLLGIATSLPAPKDPTRRGELAGIKTGLNGTYGAGEYCNDDGCRDLGDLSAIMATSRDPDVLLDAWTGWRTVSPQMRTDYTRFAELGNEGARDLGFTDVGDMWRSSYDMPAQDLETEVDRLWEQVAPLYEQLHCHVRAKLVEEYGEDVVSPTGPIPAHLTGNMWAQSWENLYPIVAPFPTEPEVDYTPALAEWDALKMVRTGEQFFTSMGLDPLPQTFWERSMFVQPEDRDAVCHASAWDLTFNDDLRLKMCIRQTSEDFVTIHHELGHHYYFHAYHQLPVLFQNGAHDGFHEAIGDAIALSITPSYLQQQGLLQDVSSTEDAVINEQMRIALAKVAFLPFGRMIDQWRWDVFDGDISSETYNAGWWELREQFQGIGAPIERSEADFDPGAKYHIPANTPYLRYFLAHILQFQLHESLCEAAGHEGPLHTCSVYGSTEAGNRLQAMLALGSSKPWPDALELATGTRQMDARALVEYFAPLQAYLEEQNEGRTCGW